MYIRFHDPMAEPAGPLLSIVIPTWNNLAYLQHCIRSIQSHTESSFEILLHINDGSDGTLDWATAGGYRFSHTEGNCGICYAMNAAASLARGKWLVFFNDDMYALPGWDKPLLEAISAAPNPEMAMVSATMIEPRETGNRCVIVQDFGQSLETFREADLLDHYSGYEKPDWSGATWPPNLISTGLWKLVGGYSIEFSPGMSSDPDFAMKLWQAGVRYFKGVSASRVYHFQAKSTGKVIRNNGNRQFLRKWGVTQSTFYRHCLRMGSPWRGILDEPETSLALTLDRLRSSLKNRLM